MNYFPPTWYIMYIDALSTALLDAHFSLNRVWGLNMVWRGDPPGNVPYILGQWISTQFWTQFESIPCCIPLTQTSIMHMLIFHMAFFDWCVSMSLCFNGPMNNEEHNFTRIPMAYYNIDIPQYFYCFCFVNVTFLWPM